MSFKYTILYSCDIFIVEEIYDALFFEENMKYLVGSRAHEYCLIDDGDYVRDKLRSNFSNKFCNCYKKKGHMINDCYKLYKKKKLVTVNQNGKQPNTLGETSILENSHDNGELLIISDKDSKLDENWIFDKAGTFYMCHIGICFLHME